MKLQNERAMRVLKDLLSQEREVEDARLSPGQLHYLAVDALGCEPLVFACNIIALAMDARSKISIQPAEAARLALSICDRIYGPPDAKARAKGQDQFELEFSWKLPGGVMALNAEGEFHESGG